MSVIMPGNVGPLQGKSHSQNTTANLPNELKHPDLANVLKGLNILAQDIVNVTKQEGLHIDMALQQVSNMPVTSEVEALLKQLGIDDAEVAIAAASQDEINRIRKKLKEIKDSTNDEKVLKNMLKLLGVSIDDETLIFTDQKGGYLVLKKSMQEIEESITQ